MQEIYVYVPPGRRSVGRRLWGLGLCPLLVWEWPDGQWCYLDQLWHWQYRHKRGGRIDLWL